MRVKPLDEDGARDVPLYYCCGSCLCHIFPQCHQRSLVPCVGVLIGFGVGFLLEKLEREGVALPASQGERVLPV